MAFSRWIFGKVRVILRLLITTGSAGLWLLQLLRRCRQCSGAKRWHVSDDLARKRIFFVLAFKPG
jgi:hypothetical protein